jgi:thiol-disulfide isomerase/thioredoxin
MLGSGKSSGVVNEASNLIANRNLTTAVEEMSTRQYQRQRDLNDVIPTHRHDVAQASSRDDPSPVYDPAAEKKADRSAKDGDDSDDDELAALRRNRVRAIIAQQQKEVEWRAKQHGQYREISQDDFFNIVVRERGGSEDVCVHFYHNGFEKCKIMDGYLQELAPAMLAVKIVKVDVERCPFLVEKLKVNVLPCLVLFHNDVAVDRVLGFEGCGDEEALDAGQLRSRIERGLKMSEEK